MPGELLRAYRPPIHNPYWDAVAASVTVDDGWLDDGPTISRPFGRFDNNGRLLPLDDLSALPDRGEHVRRFSWSVTDPESLSFVACYSRGALVDPMAGTGYWAYVLGQLGVDVACYDAAPHTNHWHRRAPLWIPITRGRAEVVVDKHPDRVLFLSWPPYADPSACRTLTEYRGDRLIYIGEHDGCTGDGDFHDLLEAQWTEVDSHRPVQWWGLHDWITVYERTFAVGSS